MVFRTNFDGEPVIHFHKGFVETTWFHRFTHRRPMSTLGRLRKSIQVHKREYTTWRRRAHVRCRTFLSFRRDGCRRDVREGRGTKTHLRRRPLGGTSWTGLLDLECFRERFTTDPSGPTSLRGETPFLLSPDPRHLTM